MKGIKMYKKKLHFEVMQKNKKKSPPRMVIHFKSNSHSQWIRQDLKFHSEQKSSRETIQIS